MTKSDGDIIIMKGNVTNRSKGLTANNWSYPPEMKQFQCGRKNIRFKNVNLCSGCSNGCLYCYNKAMHDRMIKPKTGTEYTVPVYNPAVKELALRELKIENVKRKKIRRAVVCASTTDPLLPGIADHYSEIFKFVLKAGLPLIVLSKCKLPASPEKLFGIPANNGGKLIFGITVTSLDEEVCLQIEPGAAKPADRINNLRLISDYSKTVKYPVMTWVSITPWHGKTGNVPEILTAVFEAGADFCALEILHGRTKWCRDHRLTNGEYRESLDAILGIAEEFQKPVFLKDECRQWVEKEESLCIRYERIVAKALKEDFRLNGGEK